MVTFERAAISITWPAISIQFGVSL
jgi:hypothetical protein